MTEEPLDASGRDLALEAEQRDADLKAVAETPAGQRVFARLLMNARLGRASYAGEESHATAFNEGVKHMAERLDAELERVAPEAWHLVRAELRLMRAPNLVHRGGDASSP